jgi:hypothetical protein
MNLFAQHRDRPELPKADFAYHLARLRPVVDLLAQRDSLLMNWYLKGGSREEALRFPVYQEDREPLQTVVDELARKYKGRKVDENKVIGIWNGAETQADGASLAFSIDGEGILPRMLDFNINERANASSRLGDYQSIGVIIAEIAQIYRSFYISYGPRKYFANKVFQDRPGASWLLYLPHILTPQELPEARALIPVTVATGQLGTIIVTETDNVFDVDNAEHVQVANAVEIRLADQDLLPRYNDL